MTDTPNDRRRFLSLTAGAALALGTPALAAGLAPTPTMRGGANNYRPGAPIMER
ncbi:MAG: Twin-arginine translocation pathway signal, partial [Pseudomonadota bacterium]